MMREFGFVYDSSIAAPVSDPPLWPYTLDYQIPHKCLGQRRCPSRSFPGIWEMPLNQITMEEFSCAMVDRWDTEITQWKRESDIDIIFNFSCPPYFSENELYEMFMNNFRRHYETNRAPLGLYFHTLWFKDAKNRKAFRRFLDDMVIKALIKMQDW